MAMRKFGRPSVVDGDGNDEASGLTRRDDNAHAHADTTGVRMRQG